MVDVDGKQEWKDCAEVTGLRLPKGYFFGASSATGDLSGMIHEGYLTTRDPCLIKLN